MTASDGDARNTVRVTIAGEDYTIRTEADEDYTRRCATLVDQRMKAIAGEGTAGAAQTRAAIMAALSIADDLFQQKARTRQRAQELAKRVEEALQEDGATGGSGGANDSKGGLGAKGDATGAPSVRGDSPGAHGARDDMATAPSAAESNDFVAGDLSPSNAAESGFAAGDFVPADAAESDDFAQSDFVPPDAPPED